MKERWLMTTIAMFAAIGCDAGPLDDTARSALGDEACGPLTTPLIAGQNISAGEVTVHNDGAALTLHVEANDTEGWAFRALHVYAGFEAPPAEGNAPIPGRFPYSVELSEPRTSYVLDIPLSELGAACGDALTLAVHAEVVRVDGSGVVVQRETGWALGDSFEGTDRWGWTLDYEVCCDREPDAGQTPGEDAGTAPDGDAGYEPDPDLGTPGEDLGDQVRPDVGHGDCE